MDNQPSASDAEPPSPLGQTLSVAIIGGGVAGLALAAGLIKNPHLDVHVYEADTEIRDYGAGLTLHRNGLEAMAYIGPEIRKAYLDAAISIAEEENEETATEVYLACGEHAGQVIAELGRAKGRKSLSRADLIRALLTIIPKERVHFGKRLAKIKSYNAKLREIRFTFEKDAQIYTANCLFGADGINSIVRKYILGADHPAASPKNTDNWYMYRIQIPMKVAREYGVDDRLTRTVPILLGPHGHLNCIPLNKGTRLSVGIALRNLKYQPYIKYSSASDPPLNRSDLPSIPSILTSVYHPITHPLLNLLSNPPIEGGKDIEVQIFAQPLQDLDRVDTYLRKDERQPITILGDAAHAALPFAGQGAAQAFEDAAILSCLFSMVKTRRHAFYAMTAYEQVRLERAQTVRDAARRYGLIYAWADNDGVRGEKRGVANFLRHYGKWMNELDIKAVVQEAKSKF